MKHSLLPTSSLSTYRNRFWYRFWQKIHLDLQLLSGIVILALAGMLILYSSSNQNLQVMGHQAVSFIIAFSIMIILAQIPPHRYCALTPWFYLLTIILLAAILGLGVISKGAQRWLSLGFLRFQPSEMMKIAMPMMLAWYLKDKHLPPDLKTLVTSIAIILLPVLMIAKQPDLSTSLIISATGLFVIFLTGISWRFIITSMASLGVIIPIIWHFMMHTYQKARVLTFLNPERDPRGMGYHIIQSKITIGSGGFWGKGFLHGTQTHLQFLPEHSTDFIFAVCAEELGFIGLFRFSCYLFLSHCARFIH